MPAMALVQSEVRREKKRRQAHARRGPVYRRAWVGWL
jgi:hypothetical protein